MGYGHSFETRLLTYELLAAGGAAVARVASSQLPCRLPQLLVRMDYTRQVLSLASRGRQIHEFHGMA